MSEHRALFLTPQLPYPPKQGSALRNFYLIKGLAEAGISIDLLSFATPEQVANPTSGGPLRQLCRQITLVPLPPPRAITARLRTLLRGQPDMAARLACHTYEVSLRRQIADNRYDVVQIEGIEMAHYGLLTLHYFTTSAPRPRLILDEHNAEYLLQKRVYQSDIKQIRTFVKAVYSYVQYRRLMAFERMVCRRANEIIVVSNADKLAIGKLDNNLLAHINVIPNGVDIDEFAPDIVAPAPNLPAESLVFTGVMDYRPNVDGVIWFVNSIWPLIRKQHPAARFYIVGTRPSLAVQALANVPGVVVTGEVADVRPYIRAACLYLVPIRYGGGIRLKLLQAMAMGKAIVSTSLGAEGIDLQAGHDAIIADTAASFAAATVDLLADASQREQLGATARRFVVKYSWPYLLPGIVRIYGNLPR